MSSLLMNFMYFLLQLSVSIWEQLPTIPFILHLEEKKKKNQTGIVSIAASFAF